MRSSVLVFTVLALLQRGMSFILLPFVTHAMTTAQYGATSVIAAMAALFGLVIGGFLEQAIFRWSVLDESSVQSRNIVRACGAWLGIGAPVVASSIAIMLWSFPWVVLGITSQLWAMEVLAIGLSVYSMYFVIPRVRAQADLRQFIAVVGLSVIFQFASKMTFVVAFGWATFGWVLADLIAAALSFVIGVAMVRWPKGHLTAASLKTLLKFSLPLIPHVLSFWVLGSLSRPLMTFSMSLSEIGVISAALSVAAVGTLVVAEVNKGVLAAYARETPNRLSPELALVMKWQVVAAFSVATIVALGGIVLSPHVFPPAYQGVQIEIAVLGAVSLAFGLYLLPINLLVQSAGVTHLSWIASGVGAVVILIGTVPVGAAFGADGITILTVLGYGSMAATAFALVRLSGLRVEWGLIRVNLSVLAALVLGFALSVYAAFLTLNHPLGAALVGAVSFLMLILGVTMNFWKLSRNPAAAAR